MLAKAPAILDPQFLKKSREKTHSYLLQRGLIICQKRGYILARAIWKCWNIPDVKKKLESDLFLLTLLFFLLFAALPWVGCPYAKYDTELLGRMVTFATILNDSSMLMDDSSEKKKQNKNTATVLQIPIKTVFSSHSWRLFCPTWSTPRMLFAAWIELHRVR